MFGKPTRRGYKAAVKQIVLDVQARMGWDDQELADYIGCGKETIENARKEAHALDVLTLLIFAYAFGEKVIQPVRDLYLCRPAPERSIYDEIQDARRNLDAAERKLAEQGFDLDPSKRGC